MISISLGIGIAAAGLTAVGSARRARAAQPQLQPQAHAAHLAPDQLFTQVDAIRSELEKVKREGITHALPTTPDVDRFIARITSQKEALVKQFFAGDVYGIKASRAILAFDCMSSALGTAGALAQESGDVASSAVREEVAKNLEAARRCDEQLAVALVAADEKLPEGLLADLAKLRDELGTLIEREHGTGLTKRELGSAISEASASLTRLGGGARFGVPAYGVALPILMLAFSDIDKALAEAAVAARHNDFSLAGYYFDYALLRAGDIHDSLIRAEPPVLTPIRGVFTPAPAGQACGRPYCTTVYTEKASSPGGHALSYRWGVSIPADPGCAAGFRPSFPGRRGASWYHADLTEGGPCNHHVYDAAASGHPGTVAVVVADYNWTCAATIYGTQGPQAQLVWVGPAPQPCQPVEHH